MSRVNCPQCGALLITHPTLDDDLKHLFCCSTVLNSSKICGYHGIIRVSTGDIKHDKPLVVFSEKQPKKRQKRYSGASKHNQEELKTWTRSSHS